MNFMNIDLGIFTETKLTSDHHTKFQFGYHVVATKAPHSHTGRVTLFWRYDAKMWHVEDPISVTPNTISALLVSGQLRWHIIGVYSSPTTDPQQTVCDIEVAVAKHPHMPILLLGDLNADLSNPITVRDLEISTAMTTLHLLDPIRFFCQQNGRTYTWRKQHHDGIIVTSHCDYILFSDGLHVINAQIVNME